MSCDMPRDRLWSWIHGEEDDANIAQAVQTHVSQCAVCADSVAQMRGLLDDLDALVRTPAPLVPRMPEQIGEYRIIRRLGEGGMGIVYEAQQQVPRRRVALKVIRGSHFTDEYRVRLFRREMQTLARLNHPAIAAIYDAGCAADGLHYFAMELVEGVPLSRYVRGYGKDAPPDPSRPAEIREEMTARQRLMLFHAVCEAVNYAHQRGVVHRDLKPSNILVNAQGSPKVLDFGLARIADADFAAEDAGAVSMVTEAGRFLGTLQYAGPEQTTADPAQIDMRTDVYALGIILYELLTGSLPYDVGGRPFAQAARIICETLPDVAALTRAGVSRDIRVITLKALEKAPDRRYQSAAELAEDVQRYLTNHPIKARPPGRLYRFHKMVARHRVTFGFLALLFVVVAAAAVGLKEQRDEARREAAKFRRMNRILSDFIGSPSPWKQGTIDTRVVDVLDAAAEGIDRETRDDPLVGAALLYTLGNTYARFSRFEDAERCMTRALAMRERILGRNHLETIHVVNDLGEMLYEKGDVARAEPLLREAYEARTTRLPSIHADVAQSLNSLGLVAKWRGDEEEAIELLTRAMEIRQTLAAQSLRSEEAETQMDAHNAVAQTQNNLAGMLRQRAAAARNRGEPDRAAADLRAAESMYLEALTLRTRYLGELHPETAKMHNNYAHCLRDLGRFVEAEQHFRNAIRILRHGLGDQHVHVARATCSLADVLLLLGRPEEARQQAQTALEVQQHLLGEEHRDTLRTRELLERTYNSN